MRISLTEHGEMRSPEANEPAEDSTSAGKMP